MNEHRIIEQVLSAFGAYTDKLADGQAVDRADYIKFVNFIREFADACHHGKEEDILFETMKEYGFSPYAGPLAVMLHEHNEGRALVKELADRASNASSWTDADKTAIHQTVCSFSELLLGHIQKEDEILYPMAASSIPDEVFDEMATRFEKFEKQKSGEGKHEQFHALADELVSRYLAGSSDGEPDCGHKCSCS